MGDANPSKGDATPSRYEPFTDYYLHPSEGSQLVICPVLLTVDNYEEWSRSIRNNLRSKSKLGFVDGTLSKPVATSPDYRQWGIVNSTIVAWIFNTHDSSIRSTIIIPDDAKILWDDLRDRYSLGNGPRILEIKHAIADCKQRGRSVAIYYGELNKLQNLLSSYLKLSACTCSAAAEYARMHETAMLHQFCIGLDSQKLGTVVSTLLMSGPLPTMNAAYAKIIADERKQSVSAAHEAPSATSVGFTATGSASGRSSDRLECSHCKRVGHDKDHCYTLHGFPDGGRGGRGGRDTFPYLHSLPDEKRALWEAYFASPPVWEDDHGPYDVLGVDREPTTPPTARSAAPPRSSPPNRDPVAAPTAGSSSLQLLAASAAHPRPSAPHRDPPADPPAEAPGAAASPPVRLSDGPSPTLGQPGLIPTAVPSVGDDEQMAQLCSTGSSDPALKTLQEWIQKQ
ncbi:hypothetical protein BVRB_9g209780 [Beta vulgaris subsp. vulgaris]|nr:hypothetical protein BVRB_9g209780 [Beta vulgaris subsp. vulgaris]